MTIRRILAASIAVIAAAQLGACAAEPLPAYSYGYDPYVGWPDYGGIGFDGVVDGHFHRGFDDHDFHGHGFGRGFQGHGVVGGGFHGGGFHGGGFHGGGHAGGRG